MSPIIRVLPKRVRLLMQDPPTGEKRENAYSIEVYRAN